MKTNRNLSGIVTNIQRFSTDDGAGIRTCVFLKGCPLRCQWCHNMETWDFKPEIAYYEQNCIGCKTCLDQCSKQALSYDSQTYPCNERKIIIERNRCDRCGCCCETCTSGGLVRIGEERTVDDVMRIILKDKEYYGKNGGITVSGGEPMSQFSFTYALAVASTSHSVSFMLETSGYGKKDDFLKLIPICDCFLFDCKASTYMHKTLTGVEDELILGNLDAICTNGGNVILRCPMIDNCNIDEAYIEKIACLAHKYAEIEYVQLMPYHKTGTGKAYVIGKPKQKVFDTPDYSKLNKISEQISKLCNKKVIVNFLNN